jgi:hypothetical protein
MKEIYICTDIEADGPIPGPYSMLSMGMHEIDTCDEGNSFYVEMKPISNDFVPEAMAVNGLDRDNLIINGKSPEDAMLDAYNWVEKFKVRGYKPIFVAAPAVWDGMFVHWYFMKFCGESPFGVTGAGIDLRSYWMGAKNITYSKSHKSDMKRLLNVRLPHTHNALDDAKELAHVFKAVRNI